MDIQAEKLLLIEKLVGLKDPSVIQKVKNVIQSAYQEQAVGFDTDGKAITEAKLVARAEASNKAIKEGRTKSIAQVREEMKNWGISASRNY